MKTPLYYILDGQTPVAEPDLIAWGEFMWTADRHVAHTIQGDVAVSTIFLGLDHRFDDGPPILFETMVFGGPMPGAIDRYSTWKQAEAGHADMVKRAISARYPAK